jgi:hypothetical protein
MALQGEGEADGEAPAVLDGTSTAAVMSRWRIVIEDGMNEAKCQFFWKYQLRVYDIYNMPAGPVEVTVASIIFLNFLMQCVQRQIIPEHDMLLDVEGKSDMVSEFNESVGTNFDRAQSIFNFIFLIELLVNMYGSWYKTFWSGPNKTWNMFDCVVVGLGTLDLCNVPLPGPLKMLRMLRAFRIFRLFRFVQPLREMIDSLVAAAAGVSYALVVLFIIMCIFSVLAVDFFSGLYSDCKDVPQHLSKDPEGVRITPRGLCFGEDYYGDFFSSLYTMFQILTGESWSEAAVRPIINYFSVREEYTKAVCFAIFFMVYIVVSSFVLLNVFVAILLDSLNDAKVPEAGADGADDQKPADDPQKPESKGLSTSEVADFRDAVVRQVAAMVEEVDKATRRLGK